MAMNVASGAVFLFQLFPEIAETNDRRVEV
jgi:hypothetical protein